MLKASNDNSPLRNGRISTRMSGDEYESPNKNNVSHMSYLTTFGTGGTPFTDDLKIIKLHLLQNDHPIKILMKEFSNAFIYKNRHLLFTEKNSYGLQGPRTPVNIHLYEKEDNLKNSKNAFSSRRSVSFRFSKEEYKVQSS